MKFLGRQILLVITLLNNTVLIQGMLTREGLKRINRVRNKSLQNQGLFRRNISNISVKPPIIHSYGSHKPWRTFSNWISSFFPPTILTAEELDSKLELLIAGHEEKQPGGVIDYIFNEDDCKKAKEAIGQLIQQNEKYLQYILPYSYTKYFKPNPNATLYFTLPEFIFFFIIGMEQDLWGSNQADVTINTFNRLELVEFLIDAGLFKTLSPDNQKVLDYAYCTYLMDSYKRLYEYSLSRNDNYRDKLLIFKKIFKRLDSILSKLDLDITVKKNIEMAQKERQEIEVDEQAYIRKVQDQLNREKYFNAKKEDILIKYRRRTGDFDSYPGEIDEVKNAEFNESEYQEWLKSNQNENFFGQKQQSGGGSFSYEDKSAIGALKKELELPANTPNEMVLKSVRKYIRENHSDKYRGEKKEQNDEKFAAFMGKYDETIEKLKLIVKQEREQREQREKQNRE